jgi:hypothetical protein
MDADLARANSTGTHTALAQPVRGRVSPEVRLHHLIVGDGDFVRRSIHRYQPGRFRPAIAEPIIVAACSYEHRQKSSRR